MSGYSMPASFSLRLKCVTMKLNSESQLFCIVSVFWQPCSKQQRAYSIWYLVSGNESKKPKRKKAKTKLITSLSDIPNDGFLHANKTKRTLSFTTESTLPEIWTRAAALKLTKKKFYNWETSKANHKRRGRKSGVAQSFGNESAYAIDLMIFSSYVSKSQESFFL